MEEDVPCVHSNGDVLCQTIDVHHFRLKKLVWQVVKREGIRTSNHIPFLGTTFMNLLATVLGMKHEESKGNHQTTCKTL